MPNFAEIFKKLLEIFKKLTMVQKIIVGAVAVGLIGGLIAISSFSTQTTYSLLYKSPLSPEEYARVTKKLAEWNVKFETKDDKYILVADEKESRTLRMRLGQEGIIPQNVKGWELFDVQSFTTTDFERNVNLQRALIGEMVKHLKTLSDIEDVSIQISFPKETLYTENDVPVTASVTITPSAYSDIAENKAKVNGIVQLIAKGIPGLKPENIVVVDNRGNVLSDLLVPNDLSDSVRLAREQMKIKERERALLVSRVLNALKRSIPEERLLINADIEFDWTKMKKQAEKIIPIEVRPDNPETPYDESEVMVNVPISEKKTTEDFKGPAYIPEGPAGVENNVPPGLKDKIDRFTHYQKNENIVNYQNSKENVQQEKAPYEIKRISVAVAIDGVWRIIRTDAGDEVITNGGRIAREYIPVSEEEIRSYEAWVKAAVGYDARRRDEVVVRHIPFDHTKEFEAEDAKIRNRVRLRRTLIASIIVLFVLFIGTLIYRAIARELERRRRLREEELARQQQAMREAALRAAEEEAATVELSIEEKARMELLENAINVARERPEDVARLIRTWLAEE
ncbi:MAG: flagellar basal-body MS-ring/collar protein FliF [Brevinematales bacterium]|nr:flagellar basal-body MS-ring/collar protein FliF [Brevinematales bacterium]